MIKRIEQYAVARGGYLLVAMNYGFDYNNNDGCGGYGFGDGNVNEDGCGSNRGGNGRMRWPERKEIGLRGAKTTTGTKAP